MIKVADKAGGVKKTTDKGQSGRMPGNIHIAELCNQFHRSGARGHMQNIGLSLAAFLDELLDGA